MKKIKGFFKTVKNVILCVYDSIRLYLEFECVFGGREPIGWYLIPEFFEGLYHRVFGWKNEPHFVPMTPEELDAWKERVKEDEQKGIHHTGGIPGNNRSWYGKVKIDRRKES